MTDPTLAYWEWSAAPGSDIDDIEAVRAANPAFGTRINEDFLSVERAALDDDEYARERLGIFPDADDTPQWLTVTEAAWTACGRDYPLDKAGWLSEPVTLCVEVDDQRVTWICAAGGHGSAIGGDLISRVDDPDQVVPVMVTLTGPGTVKRTVIDRGSRAAALIQPLTDAGIAITEFSTAEVVRASGQMIDAVTSGAFVHRNRPELTEAAAVASLRKAGDAETIDRWSGHNASAFIGVALARSGHLQTDDPPKGKKPGRYW